jgi:hypothetical protein
VVEGALRAVAHDLVVEAQLALGRVIAGEVVIDQHRDGLAEQPRRLALRHEEDVAIEARPGRRHRDAVGDEILLQHQPVGLELVAEQGKVDAVEDAVDPRRIAA